MIINGISFRVFERVIKFATYFFFITTLISPFLVLSLYVFEKDVALIFSCKPASSKVCSTKKDALVSDLTPSKSVLDNTHVPFIPTPDIKKSIVFENYNTRPDHASKKNARIALSSTTNTLYAATGEKIYLNCKDESTIKFSRKATPHSITPLSVENDSLLVKFETHYTDGEGNTIYKCSCDKLLPKEKNVSNKLTQMAGSALQGLQKAIYLHSDALIDLMGGKALEEKKRKARIHFKNSQINQTLFVKRGEKIYFTEGKWQTKKLKKKTPLFVIDSISSTELCGTFWNENGFFEKKISLPLAKANASLHSFAFEKLYKRNNTSIICKVNGRTFLLKPNDWLVKKSSSWHLVHKISELNSIVDFKSESELIIFDGIKREKDRELFIGYIFDATHSNYKKLEIPLKKKEKLRYNK